MASWIPWFSVDGYLITLFILVRFGAGEERPGVCGPPVALAVVATRLKLLALVSNKTLDN